MKAITQLLLTPEALGELTGFRQREKQIQWLTQQGVPFREAGRRVLVSRAAAEAWLQHEAVPARPAGGVRLDLVR